MKPILTVATMPYLPFAGKTVNGTKPAEYFGLMFEMLDEIARTMDFSYNIKYDANAHVLSELFAYFRYIVAEPEDQMYGALTINGTYNGMIGMLTEKRADIVAAALTVTYARSLVVSFSATFHFESVGILIRVSERSDAVFRLALIFSTYSWISLVAVTFMAIVIIRLQHAFYPVDENGAGRTLQSSVWFVFSSLINQKTQIQEKSWNGRMFQLFWRFASLMMCMFYISGLVATLTTSRFNIPFQDFSGLVDKVDKGEFKICVERGTAHYSVFMESDSFLPLKKFLDSNPENAPTLLHECEAKLLTTPNVAYIAEVSYLKNIKRANECNKNFTLILLHDTILPGFYGFAFEKDFIYEQAFSQKVMELNEHGFVEYWKKIYTEKEYCMSVDLDNTYTMNMKNLSLYEMIGAFVLLMGGIGLGTVVFLLELKSTRLRYFHKRQ